MSAGVVCVENQKTDYARRNPAGSVTGRGFDSPRLQSPKRGFLCPKPGFARGLRRSRPDHSRPVGTIPGHPRPSLSGTRCGRPCCRLSHYQPGQCRAQLLVLAAHSAHLGIRTLLASDRSRNRGVSSLPSQPSGAKAKPSPPATRGPRPCSSAGPPPRLRSTSP